LTPNSRKRTTGNGRQEPYAVLYVEESAEDLKQLRRRDRKNWQKAKDAIASVAKMPRMGSPLRDVWAGCLHRHFGDDKHRLIWEVDDDRGAVIILRASKKKRAHGTIYDEPRPRVE
jgi:mRNA-degrading endonuclease RelE of RelBE toxin-antitoxin system